METEKEQLVTLRPWQVPLAEKQVERLRRSKVMLSACHAGSGKTYMACHVIRALGIKTLVVCPKIAISQWKEVIHSMGVDDLVLGVVNPENLIASKKNPWYHPDTGWVDEAFGEWKEPLLMVLDECHRGASGPGSKTTLAVARWCNKLHPLNKVLAMSATPFDTPMKLRALGYLFGFHRFVENSWYDWLRTKGCDFVDIGWGHNKRRIFEFTRNKARARGIMLDIREEMGDGFISVGPDEIPDFPGETREVVLVDLAKKDHDELVKAYAEMPERIRNMPEDDMAKMLRLRQQAEWCKATALAEMAADAVEDGYSVFVALNFTDARLRVQSELEKKGIAYATVYGGQNQAERQKGIDDFQNNKIHVMIGMMQACSVALSLHDVKHERPRISLISPGYTSSDVIQALGRIRRVGGTPAVQKIVLAANSVEERVARVLNRKIDCIETLVDNDLERK